MDEWYVKKTAISNKHWTLNTNKNSNKDDTQSFVRYLTDIVQFNTYRTKRLISLLATLCANIQLRHTDRRVLSINCIAGYWWHLPKTRLICVLLVSSFDFWIAIIDRKKRCKKKIISSRKKKRFSDYLLLPLYLVKNSTVIWRKKKKTLFIELHWVWPKRTVHMAWCLDIALQGGTNFENNATKQREEKREQRTLQCTM